MKKRIISALLLATSITFFWGCGSDSSNNAPSCLGVSCIESAAAANFTVTDTCHWLPGDIDYLIYNDGRVTDANGNEIGSFDAATGTITKTDGTVIENVTLAELTELTPEKVQEIKDAVEEAEKGASEENQGNSSNSGNVTRPGRNNTSSSNSNSGNPVESSSSGVPEIGPDGFPTIESYGPPSSEYTKDILSNKQTGWNSRYWDACKPHCSWISDGQEGKTDTTTQESYVAGGTTARNCNIHDVEVPTFTLGSAVQQYWMGYEGTSSACKVGAAGVFTCTDMAPVAVNDNLSYAYVAGPGSQTTCGKCFHLQYDGSFKDASANNAPKETHKALKGKHIVVMTSNIGHDVEVGQFDLMVPGGGVGAFDALSTQVNGQNINWGAGFGGFLTECQGKLGYDNTLENYQECVKDMCDAAFGNAGFPNLLRGCHWFAEWYMAADNPTYHWEEVECPQYLIDHYMTTLNPTKENRYRWHDDWSTYKKGDELETQECLTANYPQGCGP